MAKPQKSPAPAGRTRPAAVAGQFYPSDPDELRATVQDLLARARHVCGEFSNSGAQADLETGNSGIRVEARDPRDETVVSLPNTAMRLGAAWPKAVIAPHAGYAASGPVAASAYACLAAGRNCIRRVVLLGPAHYVPFSGLAVSSDAAFQSPLGTVRVDGAALDQIRSLSQVKLLDAAHRNEHSLEVHLPFLQVVLREFRIVPILVGQATPAEVAEVLSTLWGGEETCFVVSSDLSHYLEYVAAQGADSRTARFIESLDWQDLGTEHACGCAPIRGLLWVADRRGLRCRTLDLRNSGDTVGMRDRVVGYGAFAFIEKAAQKAATSAGRG